MKQQLVFKFKKVFTSGIFEGKAVYESMPFVSQERAESWQNAVNKNESINYYVKNLTLKS